LETITTKLYEGMFLIDSALAASNWEDVNDTIKSILEKSGAEIISMKKWDERRLAYPIKGKHRGTYILVFFRVEGPKISEIERAVRLNDNITRVLILAVENPDEDYVNKEVPADLHKDEGQQDTEEKTFSQDDNKEKDSDEDYDSQQDSSENEQETEEKE
jgi:small subunit ribosomal protein S6